MRVLWIVNIVMPELAEHIGVPVAASGSWLVDISNGLAHNKDDKIAIACVHGKEFKRIELNNKIYYLVPGNGKDMLFYSKSVEKQWKRVYEDFKPDIVHIHGTEYSHGLSFMREYPSVPSVISIQGILNRIKNVDFGEIPWHHFLFGRTFRQWLKINGEIENHFIHIKNAKYEKEMFSRAKAVNGVNVWDTSIAKSINPDLKVYKIEYNLRDEFYSSPKWDLNRVQRHTIFTNPAGTPLKGLHMLIRAVALLKSKYPDIKIKVPGMSGDGGNVKITGAYSKYLHKLIKKLGMENHIEFLGKQTGNQMIENVLNSHITVIPSAIEGTSLILREAMFLGAPCVASFRGGMADFISDKTDGFLYDFSEYTVLAERINALFSDDALCNDFSRNAIIKAENAHERKENVLAYNQMYNELLGCKKKVLHINAVYGMGSTGIIVEDVHKRCLDEGIESFVAYSTSKYKNEEIIGGIQIGKQFGKKAHAVFSRINGKQAYFSSLATKRFLNKIKEISPDIVFLHNLHSNYINLNMLLEFLANQNIKTVIVMHDCWYFTGGCFHYTAAGCDKWLSGCGNCPKKKQDTPAYFFDKSANILKDREKYFGAIKDLTVVGVSDWVVSEAQKSFLKGQFHTFHNGVDLEFFVPTPSDFKKQHGIEDKFMVLGLASKWLLPINKETFDVVVNGLPKDCVMVLLGCTNAQKNNLPENVIALPFINDRQEIRKIYSAADVFVNCTREDTLPFANIEPQACGVPVVVYKNTGGAEMVDNICGFSVENGNAKAMLEKIIYVKQNGKAHFSDQCIKWIKMNFDKNLNYEKYIEFIASK